MFKLLLTALTSTVLLLIPSYSPAQTDNAQLTGTVAYRERVALPSDAVIDVQLLDTSVADIVAQTVAEVLINAEGRQVPVPFTLSYDPAKVEAAHRYSVRATIRSGDGMLMFSSTQAYPVLTHGAPSKANLILHIVGHGAKPGAAAKKQGTSSASEGTTSSSASEGTTSSSQPALPAASEAATATQPAPTTTATPPSESAQSAVTPGSDAPANSTAQAEPKPTQTDTAAPPSSTATETASAQQSASAPTATTPATEPTPSQAPPPTAEPSGARPAPETTPIPTEAQPESKPAQAPAAKPEQSTPTEQAEPSTPAPEAKAAKPEAPLPEAPSATKQAELATAAPSAGDTAAETEGESTSRPDRPAPSEASTPLASTNWRLIQLGGQDVVIAPPQKPVTISFSPEGRRIGGVTGCNSYLGTFNDDHGHLDLHPGNMTMMACADPAGSRERKFVAMLRSANGYKIDGDVLLLTSNGKTVAKFKNNQ